MKKINDLSEIKKLFLAQPLECFSDIKSKDKTKVFFNNFKNYVDKIKNLDTLELTVDNLELIFKTLDAWNKINDYSFCSETIKKVSYTIESITENFTNPEWCINLCDRYMILAYTFRNLNIYDKCLKHFNNALEISKLNNNPYNTSCIYSDTANVHKEMDNYNLALENYKEALLILEKVFGVNPQDICNLYFNIASIYQEQGNYKLALYNYQKVLNILEKIQGLDSKGIFDIYYNIAHIYQEQGESELATENYKKYLSIYQSASVSEEQTEPNLANIIYKEIMLKSQPLSIINNNINLAKAYQKQKNYTLAIQYYRNALKIIETTGVNQTLKVPICRTIAGIYRDHGNQNAALKYYRKSLY